MFSQYMPPWYDRYNYDKYEEICDNSEYLMLSYETLNGWNWCTAIFHIFHIFLLHILIERGDVKMVRNGLINERI